MVLLDATAALAGPTTITQVTGVSGLGYHGIAHRTGGGMPGGLSPFEAYLLSLMDGVSPVDDVVAASGLSVLDAALALHRLKELELVHFSEDPRAVPPEPPPPPSTTSVQVGVMTVKSLTAPMKVPASVEMDVTDMFVAAQTAARAGDFASARRQLEMLLVFAPDHPEALTLQAAVAAPDNAPLRSARLLELAAEAERANHPRDAVIYYERALGECAQPASVSYNLALLLLRTTGASAKVVEYLRNATQLDPGNALYAAMLQRVEAFMSRGGPGGGDSG